MRERRGALSLVFYHPHPNLPPSRGKGLGTPVPALSRPRMSGIVIDSRPGLALSFDKLRMSGIVIDSRPGLVPSFDKLRMSG